jgi:hypothetical protein
VAFDSGARKLRRPRLLATLTVFVVVTHYRASQSDRILELFCLSITSDS